MLNQPKYDFSKESKIKDTLLKKCLIKVSEAKGHVSSDLPALDDDELEMVTAAVGRLQQSNKCPLEINCTVCPYSAPYDVQNNSNRCKYGYVK